jgi:hypothetical protein
MAKKFSQMTQEELAKEAKKRSKPVYEVTIDENGNEYLWKDGKPV